MINFLETNIQDLNYYTIPSVKVIIIPKAKLTHVFFFFQPYLWRRTGAASPQYGAIV